METEMNRIGHIVAIVDPSAGVSQAAVDKAYVLARCLDASIELLICDIETAHDDLIPVQPHRPPPSNTQLFNLLDQLAAPVRAAGITVRERTIYGKSLHDSLLAYLREARADLVVKDTHRHSFAKRTLLGNTDWHLARGCPVPLLLTKKKAWSQPLTIMAAFDPNHPNERAAALNHHILSCAADLAARLKTDLHVIHAFIPKTFAAVVMTGGQCMAREYGEVLQAENSFKCHQIERLVSNYGVTPEHLHVEMGTPSDCMTSTVEKYHTDVMVMGASSHGRWHRMIVGSNASAILETLACDILIVKPSDEAQAIPF
jgi:universal stress protein E